MRRSQYNKTYTLAAQRVTFRPSRRQSSSPRPLASSLHFIKSSLYLWHRAPMKKDALSSGAELAPISLTLGMLSGRGVVSMRAWRSNLWVVIYHGGPIPMERKLKHNTKESALK